MLRGEERKYGKNKALLMINYANIDPQATKKKKDTMMFLTTQ